MLPLLPALILLLLHGPANIERMALDGRLPAAMDAVHRSTAPMRIVRQEQEALASLLQLSGDPQFSRALRTLLSFAADEPQSPPSPERQTPSPTVFHAVGPPVPQDGFQSSQRSRDGPISGC